MAAHKIGRGYKRTNDVSLEEVDVPKIIQPQNPHFIAKLKAGSTKNLLLVPATVLKLYQLKLQNLIFFRNKCGMHWPEDVINRKNNQIYIRGWNDFCRANHINTVTKMDMQVAYSTNKNRRINIKQKQKNSSSSLGLRRWEDSSFDILYQIFTSVEISHLSQNVSSVCHSWRLGCWHVLFWANNELDLSVTKPVLDTVKSTTAAKPLN
ncbi:hypothetical protein QYF36_001262 [Acer negundo]|nr:hypothetical protein QYF36_001262 [Acer negundo]